MAQSDRPAHGMGGERRTRLRRVLLLSTAYLSMVLLWTVLLQRQAWLRDAHEFDGVRWELAAFPGKWLHALGAPLRADPAEEEALLGYFTSPDRRADDTARLEGVVEAAIDGRLDAALRDLGFASVLGVSVWPPVNTELTAPPGLVAIAPRSRIRLESSTALRSDVVGRAAEDLERRIEAERPGRVALVVPLGGLSTYPAIVTDRASYASTVQVAAHEWVHHHFAFTALGWRTLVSREALTINETAADIAAAEIAARALATSGDPTRPPGTRPPGPPPNPAGPAAAPPTEASRGNLERDATLRALRLEVDTLLAEGRVEDAERRMEEVRVELAARGYPIRRLNQAYFAWYGTYAARPDSVDPLGSQLRELRLVAGSLPRFLAAVGGATTREHVAQLLERLRAEQAAAAGR